jgi:uncharacterized protein YbjT (DUF2867 family)
MIAIVGATGNIGSKTAEILLSSGKTIRAIARNAEKLSHLKAKGAEIAVGDSGDANFLSEAFTGAEAVLLMIPSRHDAQDIKKYQDQLGIAQVEAIKKAGVKNVLLISSQGGHTEEKTGIVAGLARQEVRLNALPDDVNVLSLRPSFFMENTFNSIGLIKNMNINGSSIKPDVKQPMIATQDIAKVAAEKLNNLDFTGKTHLDLLGDRDYTMTEVTKIIGEAIGKPELPYVEFTYADEKNALMQYGISESMADAYIGLYEGINIGQLTQGVRNEQTTTATTLEEFANQTFKFAYAGA